MGDSKVVRSEGLEPPRFYSLPPQGSASTNSATSARRYRPEALRLAGSAAADLTNPSEGYKPAKASNSTSSTGNVTRPDRPYPFCPATVPASRYRAPQPLPRALRPRQHLLDLDRDPVAVDQHDAGGHGQIVGENLDLVGLG